jgi:hypothetical protein
MNKYPNATVKEILEWDCCPRCGSNRRSIVDQNASTLFIVCERKECRLETNLMFDTYSASIRGTQITFDICDDYVLHECIGGPNIGLVWKPLDNRTHIQAFNPRGTNRPNPLPITLKHLLPFDVSAEDIEKYLLLQ